MSQSAHSSASDLNDAIRKRVCKACDRCRLKKSKCDGAHPCSRCKADNTICVFGERKKSYDKVYPKGYVEMLEQQQSQLVMALQEMYRRLAAGQSWTGPTLSESGGQPLTHDILVALNLIESDSDGSGDSEMFEEDCQKLQSRLLADGAGYVQRTGSLSSDSDRSQQSHLKTSSQSTPTTATFPVSKDNFTFNPSPSPVAQTPIPEQQQQRQTYPPAQQPPAELSPLHTTFPAVNHDMPFCLPNWSEQALVNYRFSTQGQQLQTTMDDLDAMPGMESWIPSSMVWDTPMTGFTGSAQQLYNASWMHDMGTMDPIDAEFNKFIQVQV